MNALAASLERSPELFPHSLDLRTDVLTLVRLSRADYERASFLDGRVITKHTLARALPFAAVSDAVDTTTLEERCDFIFHIGHVGSTLLSRLLGAHPQIFALREPLLLRLFAQLRSEPELQGSPLPPAVWDARLATCLKLWSRTFEPQQRSLLKATSFVSEMAAELFERPSKPRGILLYMQPEPYLAGILGGPNSRVEIRQMAPTRLKRLHRRLGREHWRLAALSEGEAIAMSWLAEMLCLGEAERAADGATVSLDFEAILAEPARALDACVRHLEIEAGPDDAARIVAGPLMGVYSKAPEHAYSGEVRRAVLADARRQHGEEIAKGLRWIARVQSDLPEVAQRLASLNAPVRI